MLIGPCPHWRASSLWPWAHSWARGARQGRRRLWILRGEAQIFQCFLYSYLSTPLDWAIPYTLLTLLLLSNFLLVLLSYDYFTIDCSITFFLPLFPCLGYFRGKDKFNDQQDFVNSLIIFLVFVPFLKNRLPMTLASTAGLQSSLRLESRPL